MKCRIETRSVLFGAIVAGLIGAGAAMLLNHLTRDKELSAEQRYHLGLLLQHANTLHQCVNLRAEGGDFFDVCAKTANGIPQIMRISALFPDEIKDSAKVFVDASHDLRLQYIACPLRREPEFIQKRIECIGHANRNSHFFKDFDDLVAKIQALEGSSH